MLKPILQLLLIKPVFDFSFHVPDLNLQSAGQEPQMSFFKTVYNMNFGFTTN